MSNDATPREVGSHAELGPLLARWAEAEGVRFIHRSDGRRSVGTVHEEGLIDLMRAVQAAERERWECAARIIAAAVTADEWCQECALENVRPAVDALMRLCGPNVPMSRTQQHATQHD